MENMPFTQKTVFRNFASRVEYASLSPEERKSYDSDLKAYRDMINQLSYAKSQGREEGMAEGRAEGIAKGIHAMAALGINPIQIADAYQMDVSEVNNILKKK